MKKVYKKIFFKTIRIIIKYFKSHKKIGSKNIINKYKQKQTNYDK